MTNHQLFSKILRTTDARGLEVKKDTGEASKKQGRSQVMNLLTIDTGAIASLATHVWHVTNALVNLVVGFWLLYSMLGISAIIGIGCIPILSSFTAILAKFIYCKSTPLSSADLDCDKSLARARDTRTGAVKEFLAGIKVIKVSQHLGCC
jgi:ABC-type multidrug transport system fused ATPase/permease subunit